MVRPGGFDLNSATATDYDIDQIIEHPNYEYPGLYNDLALIRMTKGFWAELLVLFTIYVCTYVNYKIFFCSGTNVVAKACIWHGSLAEEQVTAIGYGDTQFGKMWKEH